MKKLFSSAVLRRPIFHRASCLAPGCRVLGIACVGLVAAASSAGATSITPPSRQVATSATSIRENASEYTIDLTLPEQQPAGLNVQMEGKTLHISPGQTAGGVTQEQSFSLPAAQEGTAPSIRQEGGHIVITVAKGGSRGVAAVQAPQPQLYRPQNPTPYRQDSISAIRDQILSQFAQMRQQMDQMMNADADSLPDPFGLLSASGTASGLSSSMGLFQMKEEKDKYILSAKLPEEQAKNIKVAVDNDRTLKISSEENNSSSSGGFGSFTSSNFSQSLSLPGPVKTDQVSMNYKDGRFEITLPKG